MRGQPAAVIGAVGRRQVEHERLDAACDEPGGGLARKVGRGRAPLVAAQRLPVPRVRRIEGRRPADPVPGRGIRARPPSPAGLPAPAAGRCPRRRCRQARARASRAARAPGRPAALADRDAIVGQVTDAFRVRAVAMRRERQQFAIAAAARRVSPVEPPARSGVDPRAARRNRTAGGPQSRAGWRAKRALQSRPGTAGRRPRIA